MVREMPNTEYDIVDEEELRREGVPQAKGFSRTRIGLTIGGAVLLFAAGFVTSKQVVGTEQTSAPIQTTAQIGAVISEYQALDIVNKREAQIRDLQDSHAWSVNVDDNAVEKVSCFIDVSQAVWRLMEFGNAIANAVDTNGGSCKGENMSDDEKKACARQVLKAIYSFTIAITMVAAAAQDCASQAFEAAACTADVTAIIGNLEVAAESGIGIDLECNDDKDGKLLKKLGIKKPEAPKAPKPKKVKELEKKKAELEAKLDKLPNYLYDKNGGVNGEAISVCIAQAGLGTTFAMRSALNIINAVKNCGSAEKGQSCAVDLTGIIAALGLATSFISGAVNACDSINDVGFGDARCTSAIAGVVGGIGASVSSGINVNRACAMAPTGQAATEAIEVDSVYAQ